jgi:TusA-related sulfurtransferase
MAGSEEKRIIARGLNPPGPLLLVKKSLEELKGSRIRIIISNDEAADELMDFFSGMDAEVEIDNAGDDIHIVVDLTGLGDGR